jgi:hypothetical protein
MKLRALPAQYLWLAMETFLFALHHGEAASPNAALLESQFDYVRRYVPARGLASSGGNGNWHGAEYAAL